MFIDSMSSKELLAEYSNDLSELQTLTDRFDRSDYVARHLRKQHKSPVVVITKIFTTARRNNYIGLLFYYRTGTGKNKNWDWSSYHIGLMNTCKGLFAIAFLLKATMPLNSRLTFSKDIKKGL